MPILTLFAESPIHAGTGAELGYVDLPIQRERATEIPVIHSSGVKGVLRDLANIDKLSAEIITTLFGSEPPQSPGGSSLEPGALVFSDARLVLFPCRTAGPMFAWVTCPYLLNRLKRDAQITGIKNVPEKVPQPSEIEAIVTNKSEFPQDGVLIEEFKFNRKVDESADSWSAFLQTLLPKDQAYSYWHQLLPKALAIVSDDNLRDFVKNATEVVTRVRLDPKTKTVVTGALWTEEYLPQDSLLYSFVDVTARKKSDKAVITGHFRTILQAFPTAQFGGKETIGRGIVRLTLVDGGQS